MPPTVRHGPVEALSCRQPPARWPDSARTAVGRTLNQPRVPQHPESEHDMLTLRLFVDGMGCRRCVREVTARLRDVPGVETVAADVGRSQVRLSGSMSPGDVLRAFVGSTYAPRFLDERPPASSS